MHWNRGRRAGIVVCVVIAAVTGGLAAAAHLVNGVTPFFKAPPAALTCFSTATRECKAASIAVVENGVDTGTSYVFVIEPAGPP